MVLATIIRLELAYPGVGIFAGDSLQYLSLVTAHGVIMVFFMIIPLIAGAFANFLLPTQLGVHDVAFPRLNSAAFWFLPGGLIMLGQLIPVDRRYQRMNAFNIREVQSILKRKFFNDLINTHDHHTLFNQTMAGLRFKTNDLNFITYGSHLFYNYGIEIGPKFRSTKYNTQLTNVVLNYTHNLFFFFINYFSNNIFINYLNRFLISLINNFSYNTSFSILFKNSYAYLNTFFHILFSFNITEIYLFINNSFLIIFNLYKKLNTSFLNKDLVIDYFLNLLRNNIGNYIYILNLRHNFYSLFWLTDVIFKTKDTLKLFGNYIVNNCSFTYFFDFFFIFDIIEIIYFISKKLFSLRVSLDLRWPQPRTMEWLFVSPINSKNIMKVIKYLNTIEINTNSTNSDFYLKDRNEILKIYWSNEIYNQHVSKDFGFKKILLSDDLDYNSRLAYLYITLNIMYNIPYYTVQFILLPFGNRDFKEIFINFYNFMINWYIPLIFTDSVFTFHESLNHNQSIRKFFIILIDGILWLFKYSLSIIEWVFSLVFTIFYDDDFKKNISSILSLIFAPFFVLEHVVLTFSSLSSFIFFNFNMFDFFNKLYYYLGLLIFNNSFNNFTNDVLKYDSNYFNSLDFSIKSKHGNEELSLNQRFQRFSNPVFKYDFKSGDYFPKLYKEVYTHLFSTVLDITSGLRTSPWYISFGLSETFVNNFNNFFENITKTNLINLYSIHSWDSSKVRHPDAFYNFFYNLNTESVFLNKKYLSSDSLMQKFHKMFLGSSMQQRIYSNWRQLKFTREAWRCKLLSARHQKTLLRRYVHEDGIFWSIERNARDLLPGWAMITPFSARIRYTAIGKTDIGLLAVFLVLNSSIISAANFLVTYRYLSTLNNRKMRDSRSFFTEGIMCTSWMMLAANPMLAIGILMLLSDRHWQTSFFDYSGGGDTVLFQHMFWFFGHPEVYIVIIPCFGFTNTIISYFLKKRVSARASLLYSMYTIAFLGFFVWGHHMYMVGLAHTTRMLFSTLTVMISVPAATKIMHWCVTLANSAFTLELPLLCILTFVFLFVSGGISGMCVAHTGMDVLFHDTFYVIGHFHIMFAGAAMFACFGAFYFYFPAIFGVKYSRIFAYLHYMYYLIGHLMTFIPMFWLGYAGMPRRILDYPSAFGGWHSIISAGHMLAVAGLIAFFIMIFDSLRQAKTATRNTFGISRYNTRLSFYLYENARTIHVQRKAWYLFRFLKPTAIKLNGNNFPNLEPFETTLFSYTFVKRYFK